MISIFLGILDLFVCSFLKVVTLISRIGIIRAHELSRSLRLRSWMSVDVDVNIVFEAIKHSGRHQLRMNDLTHYTVACLMDCEAFVSYDTDFDRLEIPREEP